MNLRTKRLIFATVLALPMSVIGCGRFVVKSSSSSKPEEVVQSQPTQPSGAGARSDEQPPTKKIDYLKDYVVTLAPSENGQSPTESVESEDYSNLEIDDPLDIPPPPKLPDPKPATPPKANPAQPNPPAPPPAPRPVPPKPATPAQPTKPKEPAKDIPQSSSLPSSPNAARRQAIDYFNNGSLVDASSLLERRQKYTSEPPFIIAFPERSRFYGISDLIELIDTLSQYVQSISKDLRLVVGDLSQAHGGPIYSRDKSGGVYLAHDSHQNGLDADISFLTTNRQVKSFSNIKEMQKKGQEIGDFIDLPAQYRLFKQGVSTSLVDVFFVHEIMKLEMCKQAVADGAFEKSNEDTLAMETLSRLVIENKYHFNHFHLRLKCDKKRQLGCQIKPSFVPRGHGCIVTKKEAVE